MKQLHERRVFEDFCQAAGWKIVHKSLRQPAPPAPDIEVCLDHCGEVAFELVRLDDELALRTHSHLRGASAFFDGEFDRLPARRREALSRRFADAEITIEFIPDATVVERKKALDHFWSILERLSDRVQGQLDLRKLGAPVEFASIWIVRADRKERPRFKSFAFALPLRVPTERVKEKLRRPYVCTLPLELLAYKEIGALAYVDDLDALRKVVVEHLPYSKFRRVWVYERFSRKVFGFPNPPKRCAIP